MKSTTQLLETLRAIAFGEGTNDMLQLRQVMMQERGGREVEDVVRDYLYGHWDLDHDFIENLVSQWVLIEPGRFVMGSPEDEPGHRDDEEQREVEIAERLLVQAYPVTQEQWMAVMPTDRNPSRFQGVKRPVEGVTWWEAASYCNLLSKQEGLQARYMFKPITTRSYWATDNFRAESVEINLDAGGYRLLTEAQWEYACRAGSVAGTYAGDLTHNMPWGEADPVLDAIAWYDANSGGQTHDVCQKRPNAWGLYDMLGNVWEWTEDAYHGPEDVSTSYNPHSGGYLRGPHRVVRGGSWTAGYNFSLRAARRAHDSPDYAGNALGFRCARSV